jgi:23S rRNA pseudouridine2605 synthase
MRRRPKPPATERAGERIAKALAAAGVASRRGAEALVRAGRVRLNGQVVHDLGRRVNPARDRLEVDGRRVRAARTATSYVVYKPRGVVSTTRDPHARRTVLELVPGGARLFPVGRLDALSEGLVLLTTEGRFAHALLHPSFEVPRTYRVSVEGRVRADALRALARGVEDAGERLTPAQVRVLAIGEERSKLELVLVEGRKHEIRRMLAAVGHPVRRLVRVAFGPLRLRGLTPGTWRALRDDEAQALEALARDAQPERSGRAAVVQEKSK